MRYVKLIFAGLWLLGFVVAATFWIRSGTSLREIPDVLHQWLGEFGLLRAATIYVVLYAVRPLVLLPASLLTIASGLIFGPTLGILFTIIGENASANVAFLLARWLGREWVDARETGFIRGWDEKIRENAILSVTIMRLIYLPFDAVNYACGLTSMRHRDYFVGTFVGIIPGLISFVLLGGSAAASVEDRLLVFALAVVAFVAGLVIARMLHRSAPAASTQEGEG